VSVHRFHPLATAHRYASLPVVLLAVIVVIAGLKAVWP
jgi:hypothetical protein